MILNKIYQGKSEEILKVFPDNSIDSCVTDPPYGFKFMGKKWDYEVPKVELWKEVYRVLKPGAHILVACGTRTQHRMAVNIEDAGFEIRDVITWHYGSGFPKSLDISKAIDKIGERYEFFDEVRIFLKNALEKSGLNFKQINEYFGFATNGSGMAGHWFANITQQTLPTKEQWFILKSLLKFSDEFDITFNICVNPNERPVIGRSNKGSATGSIVTTGTGSLKKEFDITSPATDEAKEWEGWGTALKPATEFWTLCRKPLSENTVAENVLKHGTGGINIDACRIEFTNEGDKKSAVWGRGTDIGGGNYVGSSQSSGKENIEPNNKGRFPANLILDDFMAAELDKQSGLLTSGFPAGIKTGNNNKIYGQYEGGIPVTGHGDTGGASRFFYCAKASKSERGEGNNHPTVKPLKLMDYLIKLITPENGIVLDPFAGSGTTLLAAFGMGIDFIGIEQEKEHVEIAENRLTNALL